MTANGNKDLVDRLIKVLKDHDIKDMLVMA